MVLLEYAVEFERVEMELYEGVFADEELSRFVVEEVVVGELWLAIIVVEVVRGRIVEVRAAGVARDDEFEYSTDV